MECLWPSVVKFFKVLWSYFVAVARLCVWTIILFFSGLQRTLFMRSEVVGVEFKCIPIKCYRDEFDDKLAYLDKLCLENPDLVEGMMEEDVPYDCPIEEEFTDEDENNDENNGEEDK